MGFTDVLGALMFASGAWYEFLGWDITARNKWCVRTEEYLQKQMMKSWASAKETWS